MTHTLSPRERECLLWAARGKTYAEAAKIIGVSFGTVKTNLDAVRYKLDCALLQQATANAVALGILTADELHITRFMDNIDARGQRWTRPLMRYTGEALDGR